MNRSWTSRLTDPWIGRAGADGDRPRAARAGEEVRRKCACDGKTAGGASCEACAGKARGKAVRRRASARGFDLTGVPSVASVPVTRPGDAIERDADERAGAALRDPPSGEVAPGPRPQAAAGSGGDPLPAPVRDDLEPRFGHDLGAVRMHDDPRAHASAAALAADAYTIGGDIVFGAGRFAPHTGDGRALIAHEVAHVLQGEEGVARAGPDVPATEDDCAALPAAGDPCAAPAATALAEGERALDALTRALAGPGGSNRQGTLEALACKLDAAEAGLAQRMFTSRTGALGEHFGALEETERCALLRIVESRTSAPLVPVAERPPPAKRAALPVRRDPVERIEINLRSGRVIMHTAAGDTFGGTVETDLPVADYALTADKAHKRWGIAGSEPGLRFDLTLDAADPWALTYAASVPLSVTDEPILADTFGVDEAVSSGVDPTTDPNYVDNAVKGGTIQMWGAPYTLFRSFDGSVGKDGFIADRTLFEHDVDPVATERAQVNTVYKDRDAALAGIRELSAILPGTYAFYLGPGGHIWPTIVSDTTAPVVTQLARDLRDRERREAKAAEDLAVDLAIWYVGARAISPRPKPGAAPEAAPKMPAPAARTAPVVVARTLKDILDELVAATAGIKSNPGKMFEAGKRLSAMKDISAADKVKVMLDFFKTINFYISRAGVIEEPGYFVMYAEAGPYAFRFMKDSGQILYGTIDDAGAWVWRAL